MLKELLQSMSVQVKDVERHAIEGTSLVSLISIAQKQMRLAPDMSTDMVDVFSVKVANEDEMADVRTFVTEGI